MPEPIKKFYRSRTDRVIWGVCGGLGEYFGVDSNLIRTLFVVLTLGSGVGLVAYIILALIVPESPKGQDQIKALARDLRSSAHRVAGQTLGQDNFESRNILGLIVLSLGMLLLLKATFHFEINWGLVYSGIIIILGLYLLNNYNKQK